MARAPDVTLRLADRQRVFEVRVRTRNDVHRDELADAARGGSARIGGGLHRGDIAAHDGGDVAGADLLPADQRNLRGLHHGVGRLNHRDEALGLDHPECFTHSRLTLQIATAVAVTASR